MYGRILSLTFLLRCSVGLFAIGVTPYVTSAQERGDAFAFIGRLGGKPRNAGELHRPDVAGYQFYSFERDLKDLAAAAQSSLGKPIYVDGWETVFIRNTAAGRLRITLFPLYQLYRLSAGSACGLIVSGSAGAVSPITAQYGLKKEGMEPDGYFFGHPDPPYRVDDLQRLPGAMVDDLTWLNSGEDEVTVTVGEYQQHQYDPLETLPMTIHIPPLSTKRIRFTFPAAMESAPYDYPTSGDLIRFQSSTRSGPAASLSDQLPHPLVVAIVPRGGSRRELFIFPSGDPSGRPLEIRSLVLTLADKPVFSSTMQQRSKPGRGFRIPFAFDLSQVHSRLHIAFEYRLWPNSRWRASTSR
ncbi:MAG: hypothetical protein ACHQ50_11080 [Fimbriimonadales bacterium]